MKNGMFLLLPVVCLLLWPPVGCMAAEQAATEQAATEQAATETVRVAPTPRAEELSAEDRAVIELMELLQKMELLQDFEVMTAEENNQ